MSICPHIKHLTRQQNSTRLSVFHGYLIDLVIACMVQLNKKTRTLTLMVGLKDELVYLTFSYINAHDTVWVKWCFWYVNSLFMTKYALNITPWGLVMPYGDKNLSQHRQKYWLVAWWYLKQCWLIVKGDLRNWRESNILNSNVLWDYNFDILPLVIPQRPMS